MHANTKWTAGAKTTFVREPALHVNINVQYPKMKVASETLKPKLKEQMSFLLLAPGWVTSYKGADT